jgi:hypothetical protein
MKEWVMQKSILWWAASIAAAGALSAGITAQVVLPQRAEQPRVLSGSDIGFLVEGHSREPRTDPQTGRTAPVDLVTGHLVVRVNGQWVEADTSTGRLRPATN